MHSDKVLLSKRETAQVLSLSLRTIDGLIAKGDIAAIRIGKRVLVPRPEIDRFVSSATPRPDSRSVWQSDPCPDSGRTDRGAK